MKTIISQCPSCFHSRYTNTNYAENSHYADVWAVLYCIKNRQCLPMIHSFRCCSYSRESSFVKKVLKYTRILKHLQWRSSVWISFRVLLYCRICISIAQPIDKHHINILHTSISEGHCLKFRAHWIALNPSNLPPISGYNQYWNLAGAELKQDSQLMAMLPCCTLFNC